ncbi:hypothetical protein K1X76_08220 [bacterium]|nr:hypothetical protein [bacterium]
MKQIFKVMMVALLVTSFSYSAQAGHKEGCSKDAKKECCGMKGPDTSSAELKKFKALEGRWTMTTSMFGKKNQRMYTEYKVTASGSAVLETIFPGTPYEMVSVYYDDNRGKLAMTHYCMLKNRPTLKLAKSEGNTVTLKVAKVDGKTPKGTPSMGDSTYVFKDKNHFSASCSSKDPKHPSMTVEWTRVK